MKIIAALLVLAILLAFSGPDKMLNQKMPPVSGVTLNNIKIDENYFKGKVTLINFMFIGCPPCMKEINTLNKLNREFGKDNFQVLCIARNKKEELDAFNSDDTTKLYAKFRMHFKAEKMAYEILPDCEIIRNNDIPGGSSRNSCETIAKKFYVKGYPKTFVVDKDGVIRKIYEGFPVEDIFVPKQYQAMQSDIQALIKK